MSQFMFLLVNGLANGAILALAALGFVLIYKATAVLNFAQGEFLLIGAYVVFAVIVQVGWHWIAAILIAAAVAILLGVGIERFALRPLVGEPIISVIMVTIGLAQVLRAVVQLIWGTAPRALPSFLPQGSVEIFGSPITLDRLWAIGIAAVTLAIFTVFFTRSRYGIAMRAVADDQQAAMVCGISVRSVFAASWALAGVSAVVGGMLLANLVGVSGSLVSFGLVVFPVVILGGLDSIPGAMIGGAIIGLVTSFAGAYFSGGFQSVAPYLVLLLILLLRPYGLLGQVRIERV